MALIMYLSGIIISQTWSCRRKSDLSVSGDECTGSIWKSSATVDIPVYCWPENFAAIWRIWTIKRTNGLRVLLIRWKRLREWRRNWSGKMLCFGYNGVIILETEQKKLYWTKWFIFSMEQSAERLAVFLFLATEIDCQCYKTVVVWKLEQTTVGL